MAIDFSTEITGINSLERQFKPAIVRRGTNSAINKVGSKARTAGSKKTREKYNIKAGSLKKKVKLKRSKPATLTAYLNIKGRKFNAASYAGSRQTAAGVTYSVIRGQKKTANQAFMVLLSDIGRGKDRTQRKGKPYPKQRKLFRQRAKKGKKIAMQRVEASRYPIRQVVDFSAPEMFEDTGLKETMAIIEDEMDSMIMREVNHFQSKVKK